MRLAHTQVWPALRYFEAIAPLTAISISASSKTMNGALPPNSSDIFFIVPAHCCISNLPTSVEPVKVNLRTIGVRGQLAYIFPPRGDSGDWPNPAHRRLSRVCIYL